MLTRVVQALIDMVASVLIFLSDVLIPSPFEAIQNMQIDNTLLSFMAWLVPLPEIVAVLEAWCSAILIFYSYSIIMRFVKMIQ